MDRHVLKWIYARAVLWPTLAWNILLGRVLKVRTWWSEIDEHFILGARPFRKDVAKLAALGVGGVVNTCEEFSGPVDLYRQYSIEQLRIPIVDFTHPTIEEVVAALHFIDRIIATKKRVYVHCKAGRGRSATVAMAYLMTRYSLKSDQAQRLLLQKRPHVNAHLDQRPVIQAFASSTASFVSSPEKI